MQCDRHPQAVTHGGHCPACLLEAALAARPLTAAEAAIVPDGSRDQGTRRLTIQLPLGASASASVFLVRDDGLGGRVLRLKVWRARAPGGFLERFRGLRERLDHWPHERIALPLAAGVDPAGCPAVLSEFRQGVPILDALRSGTLEPESAVALLRLLLDVIRAGHARGLAHGSMVAGNVIVQARSASVHLLDFGLAAVVASLTDQAALISADLDGLSALERTVREFRRPASSPEGPL